MILKKMQLYSFLYFYEQALIKVGGTLLKQKNPSFIT